MNQYSLKWCAGLTLKSKQNVFCAQELRLNIVRMFEFILKFVFLGMQVLEWNGIPLTSKTYEEVQSIINQQSGEAEICVRLWVFPHLSVSIFWLSCLF